MAKDGLFQLISALEYGTKLHIGVCLFGNHGDESLLLPHKHTIHSNPICDEMKLLPNGLNRCFGCRNYAIKKAIRTKSAFGAICINGIYEYTKPIIFNDSIIGVIFIGNIINNLTDFKKLHSAIGANKNLLNTLEPNYTQENCETLAEIIDSHIKMLLLRKVKSDKKEDFNPLVNNIKKFIESNLEFDIEISYIAKIFNYNEKYIGRLFKSEMGITIKEYINSRRMELSAEMLSQSNESIINISTKLGYNNITYFNRVFKAYYSVSPTQYRKQHKE